MDDKPIVKMEPIAPSGEAGKDFCQVCGEKTRFIDSGDYDIDAFECKKCGAIHNIQNTYLKGKIVSSQLVSII
jgi:hypothetical protein